MDNLKILTKTAEKRYTLGVVYEPDVLDTHGEFAKAEDIESAAWSYMSRIQDFAKTAGLMLKATTVAGEEGVTLDVTDAIDELEKMANPLDDQHLQLDEPLGTVVESYIAPCDMVIGDEPVKKGSWLMGVVWTPKMFEKIKKGERTGLSMFGRAQREKA